MVVSPMTTVMYGIAILGGIGLTALVVAPFVSLFLWFKEKRLAKKIPDKLKKEVENERVKRTGQYSETVGGSTAVDSNISSATDPIQPVEVQRMDDESSLGYQGRNKPNRFRPI